MFKTKLRVTYIKGIKPKQYTLNKILQYDNIIVPIGFKTDLASVPPPFDRIFKPFRKYTRAAVLHDYAYANKIGDRYYCDRLFLKAMKSDKVNLFIRYAFYIAVRYAGEEHYSTKS